MATAAATVRSRVSQAEQRNGRKGKRGEQLEGASGRPRRGPGPPERGDSAAWEDKPRHGASEEERKRS